MARNMFLDGNWGDPSPSVESNPIVATFRAGLHFEPTRHLRIGFNQVYGTPEFDSPSRFGDDQTYTSVRLEWFF